MKQSDVKLVNTATNDTPQTLASGKVAAIGAWYPISGQALKQVAGSKTLFTSAEAKGLIYDVLAVDPDQLRQAQGGLGEGRRRLLQDASTTSWTKRPRTDAVKIMAAKVGDDAEEYLQGHARLPFLTLAEAKDGLQEGGGLDSIYGSMDVGNKFNLDNKVYKVSQKPENYLVPEHRRRLEVNGCGDPEHRARQLQPAITRLAGTEAGVAARRRLLLTVLSFLAPLAPLVGRELHPLALASAGQGHRARRRRLLHGGHGRPARRLRAGTGEGAAAGGTTLPEGYRVNPLYLPAPHKVARALLHRLHHRAAAAE